MDFLGSLFASPNEKKNAAPANVASANANVAVPLAGGKRSRKNSRKASRKNRKDRKASRKVNRKASRKVSRKH